ncbi:MAG: hypothetical protein L0H39_12360, partial [Brachybacterium sp.]|nr:hypothetical protein [Brachybacterium sp.]
MTGTAAPRAGAHQGTRPSGPLYRGLVLEWRRNRERLLVYAVLTVTITLIAVIFGVRLGFVAILLAARLPADLADPEPKDARQLRSALGISRADGVRARTLMISAGQLMLALGAAGAILLTDWQPGERHWASFDGSRNGAGALPMTWPDHLVDIGLWTGAILWTHALSGGRAFRLDERPSGLSTMARFLGLCLLAALMFVGLVQIVNMMLMTMDTGVIGVLDAMYDSRFVAAARIGQLLTLIPVLGGGIIALLLASRRWAR